MQYLLDLTRDDLRDLVQKWGEPVYRGDQIYTWLHKELVTDAEQMGNVPRPLRSRLAAETRFSPLSEIVRADSKDRHTRKILFRLPDGNTIETVLMLYNERRTVCVSTQVGCGMGCTFCATAQGGLSRNLTAGEIVAQVYWFDRWLRAEGGAAGDGDGANLRVKRPSRVTNVVMMGMGEPLANYKALMQSLRALVDPATFGLSARNITVSTVGLVPMIDRLAAEDVAVKLAISLHAPTNRLRNKLAPINKTYPLEALIAACHRYQAKTHRRVSFEYALIRGVNDSAEHARLTADLLVGLRSHVNLIPLNPIPDSPFQPSHDADADRFQRVLEAADIPTTIRLRRGIEISAGCGQLRQAAQQPELLALLPA